MTHRTPTFKGRLASPREGKARASKAASLRDRDRVVVDSSSPPKASEQAFPPRAAMDAVDSVVDPLREFAKDSIRLVKRCHKPDRKEFTKVAARTAIGFVVMGFVGFFVKLIFIPINNIIVGSG
ncbi:hypothetical protein BS78_04G058400 [Paspalum vaginatum]|nr:hypothetical protein BS78_04G058400 [Paspalum vaginatum]